MNILIFDTETINIEKCFCYNLGYKIINLDNKTTLVEKDFVIEQVWSNKQMFETSYYANKKPLYISKLRGRKAKMIKWGFAMREMIKDIETFNIEYAFAYNSDFDTKVFDFNCDWYKCNNALDYVEIFDIWGFTSELIIKSLDNNKYKDFAIANNFISESNNLMNNANVWGKYLLNNLEWEEEHTALEDSKIETEILLYCLNFMNIAHYKVNKCIGSGLKIEKTLTIKDTITNTIHCFTYSNKKDYKTKGLIVLS